MALYGIARATDEMSNEANFDPTNMGESQVDYWIVKEIDKSFMSA